MLTDSEEYLLAHSEEESGILKELTRETWTTQMNPRMISGTLQGHFLSFLSGLIQPASILEIGTFTGYSAICLCSGLRPEGILHTIDIDDEVQEIAIRYFRKAGLDSKIEIHTGDAISIIPGLDELFDLVFIDGEKREYPAYYEAVFPKVKPGGIILADNVLWGNKVLKPLKAGDHATRGIVEFNKMIKEDNRIRKFILPIRDGLTVIQKVS